MILQNILQIQLAILTHIQDLKRDRNYLKNMPERNSQGISLINPCFAKCFFFGQCLN